MKSGIYQILNMESGDLAVWKVLRAPVIGVDKCA